MRRANETMVDYILALLHRSPKYTRSQLEELRAVDDRFVEELTEKDLTLLHKLHISV